MTGLKEALGRMQSQYALIPSNNKADYTMQVMAGDYDTIRAALAEQGAEIARLRADAARKRHAGAMLANCAFNLAQRKHLTDEERRSLDLSRSAWDAAIAATGKDAE